MLEPALPTEWQRRRRDVVNSHAHVRHRMDALRRLPPETSTAKRRKPAPHTPGGHNTETSESPGNRTSDPPTLHPRAGDRSEGANGHHGPGQHETQSPAMRIADDPQRLVTGNGGKTDRPSHGQTIMKASWGVGCLPCAAHKCDPRTRWSLSVGGRSPLGYTADRLIFTMTDGRSGVSPAPETPGLPAPPRTCISLRLL